MDFVIQWACYLFAFVAGSAVAWLIVTLLIKGDGEKEAPAEVHSIPATGDSLEPGDSSETGER